MKKNLLVLLTLLMGTVAASAQDTIFEENFDAASQPSLPVGWSSFNPSSFYNSYYSYYESYFGNAGPYYTADVNGSSMAVVLEGNYASTGLESSTISIPTGGEVTLSFTLGLGLEDYFDGTRLEVSVNGGSYVDVSTVADMSANPYDYPYIWSSGTGGWSGSYSQNKVIVFPAGFGGNVNFRWITSWDGSVLYGNPYGSVIDNIVITIPGAIIPDPGTFCADNDPYDLMATPAGGVYSGPGMVGGLFDPAVAGLGDHTITYIAEVNGVNDTATRVITVNSVPLVKISDFGTICADAPEKLLNTAKPAYGIYSGTGVYDGAFNPATAGVGDHYITYTYTRQSTGCSAKDSALIHVLEVPTIDFTMVPVCADAVVELSASPAGGEFSGNGVVDGFFTAANAGINPTVKYQYTAPNGCSSYSFVNPVINALPSVSFDLVDAACENGGSFVLSGGSPAGGSYNGTGVDDGSFYPATAGTGDHTLTYSYTDANGCSSSSTQEITVNAGTELTVPATLTFCQNDEPVTISGVSPLGGYFSGADGFDGFTFTPSQAGVGTHNVSYNYENENGCVSVATIEITVNATPTPSVLATASAFCAGGSSTLSVDGTYDNYSWNLYGEAIEEASDATLDVYNSGYYTVTVSSNGCYATSGAYTISVNELPTPSVMFPANPNFCEGGAVELSTGSYETYTWKNNGDAVGTNATYQAATAGEYSVTVTDGNGCEGTSAVVNVSAGSPVVISTGGDNNLCPEEVITISSSPATSYQWFFNGDALGGAVAQELNTMAPGTYFMRATDANGCSANSAEITLVTIDTLPAPTVSILGNSEFCDGGSNKLFTGNYEYFQWYKNGVKIPGASSSSYINAAGGDFKVLVVDNNGCKAFSEPVTVTVHATPNVTLNVPSIVQVCEPNSVKISPVEQEADYTWFVNNVETTIVGAPDHSFTATQTGIYKVAITTSFGCTDTSKNVLVNIMEAPAMPTASLTATQNVIKSSSSENNQWFLNGNIIAGATSQEYTVTEDGSYTVVVSNANGCSTSSEPLMVTHVGINAVNALEAVMVYPNPCKDVITINTTESLSYSLFDANGKMVLNGSLKSTGTVNVQELAAGLYTLRLTGNNGASAIRLVKE